MLQNESPVYDADTLLGIGCDSKVTLVNTSETTKFEAKHRSLKKFVRSESDDQEYRFSLTPSDT